MPKSSSPLSKFYRLTPIVSALSFIGFFTTSAHALTVIESSSSTVNLQTLAPSETTFDMPLGKTITTTSGNGINGDASKDWILSIEGVVTGVGSGVTLSSVTVNGAQLNNRGTIRANGNGSSGTNAGVILLNGGRVYNYSGANIFSNYDGIYTNTAGVNITNDGTILTNATGVYLGAGGSFIQGVSGLIDNNGGAANHGLIANTGSFTINNAGTIKAKSSGSAYGMLIRATSSGSIENTGVISTSSTSGVGVYLSTSGATSLTNSGTINGGGVNSAGILKDNSGAATINNQAGGVISGNIGVNLTAGSSTVINNGTITGTGGRAISMSSSGNSLILDTGSILNGNVISTAGNNNLEFKGSGSTNSSFIGTSSSTGFNSIIMNGTAWNLGGDINLIGTSLSSMSVNTGSLILTGNLNNTGVGGGVTIASGASIQVGNGGTAGDVNGSIVNNGTLSFFRADTSLTLDNSVSGNGIIRLKGTGLANQSSYVLNGNNSNFSGDLVIESGARLQATSSNPTPLAHILVQDGGTLWLGSHSNYTSPLFIQGKGWTESMGQLGALRLDSGAEAAGTMILLGDARITAVFSNYTGTISGDIKDGGHGYALEKTGDGLIVLSGNNTYSGGTQINGGTLSVSDDDNLGAFGSEVSFDGGRLLITTPSVISHDFVINAGGGTLSASTGAGLAGNITGTGTLTVESGSISHSGDATHTGGTIINSGAVLTVGVTNLAGGSIAGDILNNGTHQINLLNDYAYSGVLSGVGNLVKRNTGKATLSGAGSSQGSVNVNVGELSFAQTGTFTTTGNFTTAANATTSIVADSTLSVGGVFTQANNANLNLALGSTEPVILADSAALNGVLNITGFGANAPSTASALTSTLFNVIHTSAANGLTGDFSAVNFGGVTPVDYLTLSGSKSANNQDYNVGFGLTWIAGTAKGNGSFTLANASDIFDVDVVLNDQTGTFSSGWDGKTLTKAGAGTLILSAANTYTGNTLINAGKLQTSINNALINSANVTVQNGAILDLNNFDQQVNNLSGAGSITLGSAALSVNSATSTSFSGVISGSGRLVQSGSGSGTLTLSGVNTYTGGSTISGSVVMTQGSALGTGLININGGLLQMDFASDSTVSNQITGISGLLTKENTGVATLTGSGSSFGGSVAVNGGTLALSQSGAFHVGNYTTNGGAATTLAADSLLTVDGSFSQSASSTLNITAGNTQPVILADTANLAASSTLNISGYSALASANASDLADNTYRVIQTSGANHLTGDFGSVNIGGSSSPVDYLTLTGTVDLAHQNYDIGLRLTWYAAHTASPSAAHGTFTLSGATDQFNMDAVLANEVANANTGWDSRSLTKAGAGTLILSKANTYTGVTLIDGGTLKMGVANAIALSSDVTVSTGSRLDLDGFNQSFNNLSGAGQITLGSATLSAYNNTVDTTFSGQISGSGSLVKEGANTLILAGNNIYTGTTTINAGTLQLGDGGASGSVLGDIVDNGVLSFNRSNDLIYSNVISGSGSVVKEGANTLVLTNDHTYLGGTTINIGTLQIGLGGTSGSITGDVLNNAALVFNRTDDIQYDHIVSGTGSLTKEGDGALTLNTAQTYTGTTNVNHGTLIVGDDTHSGAYLASTQVNIASGAIFGGYGGVAGNVNNQGTLAVADALAPFSNSAAGTFTIGGDLTNSGNIVLASVVPASRLIINGNYIGNNGLITLSTALNSDSNSATDKIEILGDSSGHTNVKINNANGSGDQTINGIEIISIGGQSNGTFSLVGRVVAGAYDYDLVKNSSDGDWYLRSFKDNGGDGPKWRPEVGAYLGNQYLASAMQVHTLYDRQSSVHSQNNGSGWVRVITRKIDSKAANGQVDQDSDYNLIQFGGDVAAIDLGQSRLHLGAMGSYGSGDTDATTDGSSYKAKGDVDGYNIGLYATWFADFANAEVQKGLYVDGWVQGGWYDNKVQGEALNQEKYDSRTWATSLEAGYSFELVNNAKYALLLTPQAQVVYSNYQADDHTEQNGSRITNQDGDTVLTRLGARLSGKTTFSGREIQPFFEMNWWHSNKNNSIALSEGVGLPNQTVEQGIPKDRAEFKAGVQGEFSKNWSGWLNVGVQTGSADYKSIEGFAGVKYIF